LGANWSKQLPEKKNISPLIFLFFPPLLSDNFMKKKHENQHNLRPRHLKICVLSLTEKWNIRHGVIRLKRVMCL